MKSFDIHGSYSGSSHLRRKRYNPKYKSSKICTLLRYVTSENYPAAAPAGMCMYDLNKCDSNICQFRYVHFFSFGFFFNLLLFVLSLPEKIISCPFIPLTSGLSSKMLKWEGRKWEHARMTQWWWENVKEIFAILIIMVIRNEGNIYNQMMK